MFTELSRLTNNAAGLEKVMRLIQSMALIRIGLESSPDILVPWTQGSAQLGLSRRYFRLLKWIDCWSLARTQFLNTENGAVQMLLAFSKSSLLGIYFFLEMFTITNAMGVTNISLGHQLQTEANKFWFYGLCSSIALSLVQLFASFLVSEPKVNSTAEENEKPGSKAKRNGKRDVPTQKASKPSSAKLLKQLAIDTSDLALPGSALGWIPADKLAIGVAMFISSSLAIGDIWNNVQAPYVTKVPDSKKKQ